MNEADAVKSALGGKAKAKKLRVHEVHIKKGHKGGFIAKHRLTDQDGNPHHDSPEYPIQSMAALKKHLEEHMGEESAEEAGGGGEGGEGAGGY